MEQKTEQPAWKTLRYFIPVFIILAILLVRWTRTLTVENAALSNEEVSSFNASEEDLRKNDIGDGSEPDLVDTGYSLRYQSARTTGTRVTSGHRELWDTGVPRGNDRNTAAVQRKAAQPADATTASEHAFLRKYGPAVKKYQDYLTALGERYIKKYPIARQIDSDFAKMDRYMALKRQFDSDRDAYKWARGVMALPEVRSKLISYSSNPEAIKVALSVVSEVLSNPPPQPIYDEVLRFVGTDEKAAAYVSEMTLQTMGNVSSVIPALAASGVDLAPLAQIQQIGQQMDAAR